MVTPVIYLIGSLRNPAIPDIAKVIRANGFEVFDDWHSAGPEADDYFKHDNQLKGLSYKEALNGYAAKHIFNFDKYHLDRADIAVLSLPAGNSCHIELGYAIGQGKAGYVLFPPGNSLVKLPPDWRWFAGLYEGEGSCTASEAHGKWYPRITIGMTDKDVLERVITTTGIGKINGPYNKRHLGKKPMYFWQPGKAEDIIYIIRGIWHDLSLRRKLQIMKVFSKIGLNDDFKSQGKPPYEFRWDLMYQFAKGVYFNIDKLIEDLIKNHL